MKVFLHNVHKHSYNVVTTFLVIQTLDLTLKVYYRRCFQNMLCLESYNQTVLKPVNFLYSVLAGEFTLLLFQLLFT